MNRKADAALVPEIRLMALTWIVKLVPLAYAVRRFLVIPDGPRLTVVDA